MVKHTLGSNIFFPICPTWNWFAAFLNSVSTQDMSSPWNIGHWEGAWGDVDMLIIKGKGAESKRIRKSCDYFLLIVCQVSSNLETVLTNNDSTYENPWYVHSGIWAFLQSNRDWVSQQKAQEHSYSSCMSHETYSGPWWFPGRWSNKYHQGWNTSFFSFSWWLQLQGFERINFDFHGGVSARQWGFS